MRSLKKRTEEAKVKIISICASDFTMAACCSVMAMNQPKDAEAPASPTMSEGRHAAAMRASSVRSRQTIQAPISKVWKIVVTARVTAACIMKLGPARASEAAR